jgi:methionine-rich copper-binding protein CopC
MIASPALSHPKLVSSMPAAKATVSNVSQVSLAFSESLVAPVSGAELTMTSMPGMANHRMKISGVKTSVGQDGKTLVAAFAKPLAAGTYQLDWHVVSTDTHRVRGTLAFTVR